MSKEFRNEYPTATAGYAIIEGADVSKKNPDLRKLQAEIMKMLQGITKADIESSKNLQSFRNMYSKMGVNWHSRRPSPEALLRRISQGKELYQVNDMVDAYNLVVMTQQVSVGAFDLDQLKKPFELKIADGSERIEVIGGEVKDLDEGEVCYFDQNGPYNLDYNYRDAERSKITKESERILINTEGVGDIADSEVEKALKLTIAIIQQFCGGKLVDAGLVKASGASQRYVHEVRDEYPYDDKKITVVVADDIEPGIATNVVGHLTTSVGKNADDIMGRPFYTDKSGEKHIGISRYPVIILKGKKSKIEKLIDQARDENLLVVDYPKEMFETRTDDDLNQALEKKAEEELEYYGVALCGDKDKVEKLTKNFSLYK
jgi:DNA/RNA-binding domain of Phe-tRNA-synthetase-like protein